MEIWKPVFGYEGLYEISNLANEDETERLQDGQSPSCGANSLVFLRSSNFRNRLVQPGLMKTNTNFCRPLKRKVARVRIHSN